MVNFIAGILIVTVIFLCKCMFNVSEYFKWKNKINVEGTVKKLNWKKINYENKKETKVSCIDYIYTLEILLNGMVHMVNVKERVYGNKPSELQIGSRLLIFYDEKKGQAENPNGLKKEIRRYLFGVIIGLILVFVCASL